MAERTALSSPFLNKPRNGSSVDDPTSADSIGREPAGINECTDASFGNAETASCIRH
jgi:hypothetical protein